MSQTGIENAALAIHFGPRDRVILIGVNSVIKISVFNDWRAFASQLRFAVITPMKDRARIEYDLVSKMSDARPKPENRILSYVLQAAFLIWIVVVNVLYYLQFKQLFFARFSSLVHR